MTTHENLELLATQARQQAEWDYIYARDQRMNAAARNANAAVTNFHAGTTRKPVRVSPWLRGVLGGVRTSRVTDKEDSKECAPQGTSV
jgi:hypothetical protein